MADTDTLRGKLAELLADEQELTRLQGEQEQEAAALKASSSRDFAALASIEGKRAALSTMLQEQRQAVAQVRAQLEQVEAAQRRAAAVGELRARCAALAARREKAEGLLRELGEILADQLAWLTSEREAWGAELEAARAEAQAVFGLPSLLTVDYGQSIGASQARAAWQAAFEEIGPGAAEALRHTPYAQHTRALEVSFTAPAAPYAVDLARRPVLQYLDRPVSLTVAAALAEADRAAPHRLRGGER